MKTIDVYKGNFIHQYNKLVDFYVHEYTTLEVVDISGYKYYRYALEDSVQTLDDNDKFYLNLGEDIYIFGSDLKQLLEDNKEIYQDLEVVYD